MSSRKKHLLVCVSFPRYAVFYCLSQRADDCVRTERQANPSGAQTADQKILKIHTAQPHNAITIATERKYRP